MLKPGVCLLIPLRAHGTQAQTHAHRHRMSESLVLLSPASLAELYMPRALGLLGQLCCTALPITGPSSPPQSILGRASRRSGLDDLILGFSDS